MTQMPRSERELELVEIAKRVLPAGGFGNVTTDVVIREGRGGHVWEIGRAHV